MMAGARKKLLVAAMMSVIAAAVLSGSGAPAGAGHPAAATGTSPIEHLVIVYQENHSFDDVLERFCVITRRCDGATSGQISNGSTIPLTSAPDVVPQ
jgi:hypothetical protein